MSTGPSELVADSISRERSVHGEAWRSVHGRYFSDPNVARPFLDEIMASFEIRRPDTIADIGGGTGLMLRRLYEIASLGLTRLVNVDASQEQLEACREPNLKKVCGSIMDLDRAQLAEDGSLTLISRSVLHYFGQEQRGFLEKLRSLLRTGEVFVHQPACFEGPDRTACMNDLYRIMGLNKTYYELQGLEELHRRAGFEVLRSRLGPPLDMRSEDLAVRYHLDGDQIEEVIATVRGYGLDRDGTYELASGRFRTAFTYRILTLRAV
jgi:SAM-dependent methyltransferase